MYKYSYIYKQFYKLWKIKQKKQHILCNYIYFLHVSNGVSVFVCVRVFVSCDLLKKATSWTRDAIKSLSSWCQKCTQASFLAHKQTRTHKCNWLLQADVTVPPLNRVPNACATLFTYSPTSVEIWLPYFTAATAFVNANCFLTSPTPSFSYNWTIPWRLWLLRNWRNNPLGMRVSKGHLWNSCTADAPCLQISGRIL